MVDTVEWVGVPSSLFLGDGPSPAAVEPSGWLAVELDQYFSEPAALDDAALVDALVGFERVAAWAQAKQARLIAELAVRRDEPGRGHRLGRRRGRRRPAPVVGDRRVPHRPGP